jgi:hypothetical protein
MQVYVSVTLAVLFRTLPRTWLEQLHFAAVSLSVEFTEALSSEIAAALRNRSPVWRVGSFILQLDPN